MRIRLLSGALALVFFSSAATAVEPWNTFQGNASHSGYVPVSVDPSRSKFLWSVTIPSGQPLNPVTAAEGRVFVTDVGYFSNAGLYVLNAATGGIQWSTTYGDVFSVNPPAYDSGKVYVQTGNHYNDTFLRAYDVATGQSVFQAPHSAQS